MYYTYVQSTYFKESLMNDPPSAPPVFTPEQEARIRELVRDLLSRLVLRNVSIFGADDSPGEEQRVPADLADHRER